MPVLPVCHTRVVPSHSTTSLLSLELHIAFCLSWFSSWFSIKSTCAAELQVTLGALINSLTTTPALARDQVDHAVDWKMSGVECGGLFVPLPRFITYTGCHVVTYNETFSFQFPLRLASCAMAPFNECADRRALQHSLTRQNSNPLPYPHFRPRLPVNFRIKHKTVWVSQTLFQPMPTPGPSLPNAAHACQQSVKTVTGPGTMWDLESLVRT